MQDEEFEKRRAKARSVINKLDQDVVHNEPERVNFFNQVYDRAGDDAAQVPWADLEPKAQIKTWLASQEGAGKTAIDVACGLGDHAEEFSKAGYQTSAFDISQTAIEWAKKRFPASSVNYSVGNLFDLPKNWIGSFDLVNEVYTLQALPPEMLKKSASAIASLVKPGGILLVYTRLQKSPEQVPEIEDGPPWPLAHKSALIFAELGFELVKDERFELTRPDRTIPHQFAIWRKTDANI